MKVTHSTAFRRQTIAFTLIELLVVIAIIAILAAILFPVFAKVREKARQSSCASNMKQMTLGILQYQQDYDEMFPMGETNYANGWYGWPTEIAPYIKSTAVLTCPDDPNAGKDLSEGWFDAGLQVSYAVNGEEAIKSWGPLEAKLVGPMGAVNAGWDTPCMLNVQNPTCNPLQAGVPALTDAQVTVPDQSILMCEQWSSDVKVAQAAGHAWESGNGTIQPSWSGYSYVIDGNMNPIPQGDYSGTFWPQGTDGETSAHNRDNPNNGLENFAFCDGHVKAMQPRDTFPLGWASNGWALSNDIGNMWDATRNTTTGAQF